MVFEVMLAVIDGRFDDAERLAEQAHDFGAAARTDSDAGVYGVHMYVIRREQGRLDEVAPCCGWPPPCRPTSRSGARAWPPCSPRPGCSTRPGGSSSGSPPTASPPFPATPCGPAVSPSSPRCASPWATGTRRRPLRELEPYRGSTMMVGFTICLGPAERLMGGLAALLGRRADAEAHFAAALASPSSRFTTVAGPCAARLGPALGDRPDLVAAAHATAKRTA